MLTNTIRTYFTDNIYILTGTSNSGGKGLTAVSTATWIRFPATAKFNIRTAATQISPLGLGRFWRNCV